MKFRLRDYLFDLRHSRKVVLDQVTLIGVDCVDAERLKLVMELCQSRIRFGDVRLLSDVVVDVPYWTKIDKIESTEAYSNFIARRLSDYVKTKYALVVQYDGFILNPLAWTSDFLKYDYIGAPWWFTSGNNIGNGGFSFRSKKFMDLLANDLEVKQLHPEDYVFCHQRFHYLVNQGIKFAPHYLASRFSTEGRANFEDAWNGAFGFHGLNVTDISSWKFEEYAKPSLIKYFEEFRNTANAIYKNAKLS